MRTFLRLAVVGSLALAAAACGDDPVSFSKPVGLSLKVSSGDVVAGSLMADKNVNTESGNPYGAFISEARNALGGDPSRVEITKLELTLEGTSKNVTAVNEVFNGTVKVEFIMSDSGAAISAGNIAISPSVTGAGPLAMTVTFDSATITQADWPKFIAGGFKVKISGPAQANFAGKSADADLKLTLSFAAFDG